MPLSFSAWAGEERTRRSRIGEAIGYKRCTDRLKALLGVTVTAPGENHFVQPVNKTIRPFLMFEPIHCQRFPAMPVGTH